MKKLLTVIQPADSQDLTTLVTAKRELGITDATQDAHVLDMIHWASNAIATHCDRVFGLETVEERFWPEGWGYSEWSQTIWLNRTPVQELISLSIDGQPLAANEYRLDARVGAIHRVGACWPYWSSYWGTTTDGILVRYRGGYQLLDGVPFAIERAALILLKEYAAAVARDPALRAIEVPGLGRQEFNVGGSSAVSDDGFPPMVGSLLDPFKRHA